MKETATLGRLGAFAAVLTALGAIWLVLLQNTSAAAAGMSWIIDHPLLNFVLYPLVLAPFGAIGVVVLELIRRALFRRVNPWAWATAWAALTGFALRASITAGYRADNLPGGIPIAIALQGVLSLGVAAVAIVLLARRNPRGAGDAFPLGIAIMLPTVATIYLFHVAFLTDRHQVLKWGLLGWPMLGLISTIGVFGVLLGRALWPVPQPGARFNSLRVGALVIFGAIILGGLQVQRARIAPRDATVAAQGPDILLIVLDTLRRDTVSAYGVLEGLTPNLDAFAAEGVLWEDAIAPGSWTIPSHASLFTGAVVSRHGAGQRRKKLRERPGGARSPRLPTIAEVMRDQGWHTAAFVNNAQLNRTFSWDRGFDEYYEMWTGRRGDYDTLGTAVFPELGLVEEDQGGRQTNRALAAWFKRQAATDRPSFCFVNYVEPHAPYDPPAEWRDRFLEAGEDPEKLAAWGNRTWQKALKEHTFGGADGDEIDRYWRLYLGGVAYQDHIMGELFDSLEEAGVADETVVIITSDHGENFGWHGQLDHGWELNDDLIRIPLIARGPAFQRASSTRRRRA